MNSVDQILILITIKGQHQSIGVFLFGQGSREDRLITNMVPIPTTPFLESSVSGSANFDA